MARAAFAAAAAWIFGAVAWAGTGDVNGDGVITPADAAMSLRIAGGHTAPTFAQYAAADVTGDGIVTVADAVRIVRIARGLDAKPPAQPMPAAFSLTVSANATRNVALPGGYAVRGRVRDRASRAFPGTLIFRDTAGDGDFGPFELDAQGNYSAVLPPGRYQAISLSTRAFSGGLGEPGWSETATALDAPFTVRDNETGRNFTRPDLAATFPVTFNASGPSWTPGLSMDVVLTDAGAQAATFGWNYFRAGFLSLPSSRPVPRGEYYADVRTAYALSSGQFQNYNIYYEKPLEITRATSRTLAYPTLYELSGSFTGAAAAGAADVLAQQDPVKGRDVAEAMVNANGVAYRMAMPAGALTLSVRVLTPYVQTDAERLLPFTMPARQATKDINLPAFPAFRTISGQAFGPDGKPAAYAEVAADSVYPAAIPAAGVYLFHARTTADAAGRYSMALPDGAYSVTVRPESPAPSP